MPQLQDSTRLSELPTDWYVPYDYGQVTHGDVDDADDDVLLRMQILIHFVFVRLFFFPRRFSETPIPLRLLVGAVIEAHRCINRNLYKSVYENR